MFQSIRKPFLIEFFTKEPTAFHPQSNGIYERFHWNTCRCDKFFHQDGYEWDEYVPYSVVAYICTLYTFTSLFAI
jgi:hypothetical protein